MKFGDKEIQDNEFGDGTGLEWYDFGARLYDVQIGRWMVPDAAAEESLAWTPYRYGFDNPVCYIDPDGNSESVADMVKKAWNATPDDGASSFTMQDGELQEQPDPEVNRIRMRYRDMIATASKKGIIWRQITCSILLMVAAKQ